MLLNYKTQNFGCFENEVKFSLMPGKVTERFQDNVTVINNKLKVSKVAVIAGENAGGKTLFMTSLDFLRNLIKGNIRRTLKSFCYDFNSTIPQKFEISVLISDKIFTYYLEIDSYSKIFEKLEIRNSNQSQKYNRTVFSSKRKKLEFVSQEEIQTVSMAFENYTDTPFIDSKYQSILNSDNSKKVDKLLITSLDVMGIEAVIPFVAWIKEKLIIDTPKNLHLSVFEELEESESNLKIMSTDSFFDVFRLVDSSIIRIDIDDKNPLKETKIIRQRTDGSTLTTKMEDDSTGVRDFFTKSIKIWKVIYEDATLFADEMDKVLNVVLASKVLSYIKGSEHKGQFIFSTHNAFHLNTIDFMKEQIFFINKNIDTLSSEIYSLSEFKDYRYNRPDVYTLYLKGLFGAIPR
ncbi:AAA family ATPase [Clostridium estertheticum]|uniref:AAA family ATPase n=1 Tax=Clostridium estertheticum TaxID=238834 RepID=UPI001CF4C8FF|nr:ATP-binding protein [Clostridium estertheticum]MCB2357885.1 ATP-binding protein [Clostridium estertheticum]